MHERFDVVVIGAGIAGASAAFWLSTDRRVLVLERESHPGRHATGRSAAVFVSLYGNETVQALTEASRAFFAEPPTGFADYPLLSPRGCVRLAPLGREAELEPMVRQARADRSRYELLDAEALARLIPVLRPGAFGAGLLEADATDLDVDAALQGFLRGVRAQGGLLRTDAAALSIDRRDGLWDIRTPSFTVTAPVVVNAAGAWADEVARLAGVRPLGLAPLKRTAIHVAAPDGADIRSWPFCVDLDETLFFKPDAGRILASPADETPCEPSDVWAEELDVAVCAERLQAATTLEIKRVVHSWAGLRTFAPDRAPVVGRASDAEGFYWLAGQGGFGVQTAPALGRLAAALVCGRPAPPELLDAGLEVAAVDPARFASPTRSR